LTATSRKTALITGAAGQDGTLLRDRLLADGYRVIGVMRPGSGEAHARPRRAQQAAQPGTLELIEADVADPAILPALLSDWRPDEVYHLAAVHHSTQDNSQRGLRSRQSMLDTNFGSTRALAFAVLESGLRCNVVFAASSQMFRADRERHLIDESSPRNPSTFYGHIKSWSTDLLSSLRADHGLRASTAILFNHESPLRRPQFVSRKVTQAAAAASLGRPVALELLNIGSRVDFSSARDVVEALHLMGLAAEPRDYVVSSGELQSIRGLLESAFGHVGLDWREFTTFRLDREEPALCGQPRLIEAALGWRRTWSFAQTIAEMVDHDLAIARNTA